MKTSIVTVIAYYNGADYIERALKSIAEQTLHSDEVVVVDDGSKSEHHEYLKSIQSKYDFKLFRKENGGQGDARNFGVKNSISTFITFLDQDDFYLPKHNELLMKSVNLEDSRFGWVYGDLWHADGDGKVVSLSILSETKCQHPKSNIKEMLSDDLFILPSAALISRKAFQDVGGFDTQFRGYEDDDLFIRIFRNGWSNTFINHPVTAWCINSESTSYSVRMAVSRVRYFKKLIKFFPDSSFNETYYTRDILIPRFLQMVLSQAVKYCQSPNGDVEVYLNVIRDFQIELDRFDYVSKSDRQLVSDVVDHLKNHVITHNAAEKIYPIDKVDFVNEKNIPTIPYKEVRIAGRNVKFIDFEKFRNSQ